MEPLILSLVPLGSHLSKEYWKFFVYARAHTLCIYILYLLEYKMILIIISLPQ